MFAALAREAADVVDHEHREKNRPGILRAVRELRELVDLLPLREREEAPPGDDGGTPRGRVLELLDSSPSLGH